MSFSQDEKYYNSSVIFHSFSCLFSSDYHSLQLSGNISIKKLKQQSQKSIKLISLLFPLLFQGIFNENQYLRWIYYRFMINKNQWSLCNYADKDINQKILSIEQLSHNQQDFTKMLYMKESYEKDGIIPKPEIILKVLNRRAKKYKEEQSSNLCSSCFEELNSTKFWCRMCGNSTCKKCLVRERELKDETKTFFCQKCDQQHLRAMSAITFYNKAQELQKAFTRLVKQQQSIEELVNLQKRKLMKNGTDGATSSLIVTANQSARLMQQNKIIKIQCQQLHKKLQFGKNINKNLRKKLHELRKKQKQSFGTISNNDEYHLQIDPPKLELDMSLDNIRDSIITVEQKRQDLSFMEKCKCAIY